MNALVYVNIDQGIHKVKLKNALNEKRKKLLVFSFSINIANFEAFCQTKKVISNLFFLKSAIIYKSYLKITLQKPKYKLTIQMHTYFAEITEE